MKDKLSSEQIKNWRRVLSSLIGPYAFIMSEEEIQQHRDKMQREVSNIKGK